MLEGQCTLGDLDRMSIEDVDTHIRFLDAWTEAGDRLHAQKSRRGGER